MTIRNMISAAREQSASEFETNFQSIVAEKLSAALNSARTQVVSNMFGISAQPNTTEDE